MSIHSSDSINVKLETTQQWHKWEIVEKIFIILIKKNYLVPGYAAK